MNTFRLVLLSVLFLGAAPVVAMNPSVPLKDELSEGNDSVDASYAQAVDNGLKQEEEQVFAATLNDMDQQKREDDEKQEAAYKKKKEEALMEYYCPELVGKQNHLVAFYKRPTVMVPLVAAAGALAAAITGAVYKCVSYMQDSEFAAKSRLERIKLGVKRDFAKIKTVFSKKAPAYKKVS